MHAVIRRYLDVAPLLEVMDRQRGEVEDVLRALPGFVSYTAVRSGDALTTITVCVDRAATEASTARVREWVRENVPNAQIPAPDASDGEVFIAFGAGATPSLGSAPSGTPARA